MHIKPQYKEGYCLDENLEIAYEVRAFVNDYADLVRQERKAFNERLTLLNHYEQSWGRGVHVLQLKEI